MSMKTAVWAGGKLITNNVPERDLSLEAQAQTLAPQLGAVYALRPSPDAQGTFYLPDGGELRRIWELHLPNGEVVTAGSLIEATKLLKARADDIGGIAVDLAATR